MPDLLTPRAPALLTDPSWTVVEAERTERMINTGVAVLDVVITVALLEHEPTRRRSWTCTIEADGIVLRSQSIQKRKCLRVIEGAMTQMRRGEWGTT